MMGMFGRSMRVTSARYVVPIPVSHSRKGVRKKKNQHSNITCSRKFGTSVALVLEQSKEAVKQNDY